MKKINLLIVDDHQLVIDGIKSLLDGIEEILVIATALNGKEALEKLVIHSPDIILMDIDMPVMNGYDATKEILHRFPSIKIIALSMFSEKALIQKMMDAGVSGYVLKNIGRDELYEAIRKVSNNKQYLSTEVTLSFSKPTYKEILTKQNKITPIVPLTDREIEILILIALGLSNTEISKKINISFRTVDNHRTNIMKKLNVHNIAGIIHYAFQTGLVE